MTPLFLVVLLMTPGLLPEAWATSEEARRHMVRGEAAVEMAQDKTGLNMAVEEFEKAIQADPDLIPAYYNLGTVLDKAGRHDEAIQNLTTYLEKAPNAPDAVQVQDLIYKIEFRRDAAQQQQQADQERLWEAQAQEAQNLRPQWWCLALFFTSQWENNL